MTTPKSHVTSPATLKDHVTTSTVTSPATPPKSHMMISTSYTVYPAPSGHMTTPASHMTTSKGHVTTPTSHTTASPPSKTPPTSHMTTSPLSKDHMTTPTSQATLKSQTTPVTPPNGHMTSPKAHVTTPKNHMTTSPAHAEKLTPPKALVKETEYMSEVQKQRARVSRIRQCIAAATVIQRAWRQHRTLLARQQCH